MGERATNLEQAIAHAQEALQVRTREADPTNWAAIQNDLANIYGDRILGDRQENIEQAIAHYQRVLQVYTREANPRRWAGVQHNLGATYINRISGDRATNLKLAIAHYEQALQVYTCATDPITFQLTQRNLGDLHFSEGAWGPALSAYQEAIRGGQMVFGGAYTEAGRLSEAAQTATVYIRAAYALLKVGRTGEALVQLEQGRTRLLSQALALNELDFNLLPGPQQKTLRDLRDTIRALETDMRLPPETMAHRDERVLAARLNQARTELYDTFEGIRAVNSDFMREGLGLSEILALIPLDAALVAPIVTSQGSAVFVIPSEQSTVNLEHVLWIDGFRASDLQSLLSVRTEEAQLGGWLGAYFNACTNMEAWFDTIEATSQVLWTRLMAPIAERLATLRITQVLLLPQGGLGLLPLHAAWREVDGTQRYFLDDYSVTYLPSVYARKVSSERISEPQRQKGSLLALINPTEDLPFTPAEGEQIASLFEKGTLTVLSGADATIEAVMKQNMATYVHFSCHGFYNWHHPMQSGLVLAKGERLTVAQIIGKLNLDSTRLVTLSACETGITDIRQAPDEYQGLPAGFLQAGAPTVVSTLWAVNDLSTMLLMGRFYFFHLRQAMGVSEALRQAQIWLRDITTGKLAQHFADERKTMLDTKRMSIETASAYLAQFGSHDPKQRPFAHPYYWAAFTVSGA